MVATILHVNNSPPHPPPPPLLPASLIFSLQNTFSSVKRLLGRTATAQRQQQPSESGGSSSSSSNPNGSLPYTVCEGAGRTLWLRCPALGSKLLAPEEVGG